MQRNKDYFGPFATDQHFPSVGHPSWKEVVQDLELDSEIYMDSVRRNFRQHEATFSIRPVG